jgi:hypothetical protein
MSFKFRNKTYYCSSDYFDIIKDNSIYPLQVRKNISNLDREIAFIKNINNLLSINSFVNFGTNDKGYVPINCQDTNKNVYFYGDTDKDILYNFFYHGKNININKNFIIKDFLLRIEPGINIYETKIYKEDINHNFLLSILPISVIIISDNKIDNYISFEIINTEPIRYISINKKYQYVFHYHFHYYLDYNNFTCNYDNLINLLIMVKNAGDDFKSILEHNIPYVNKFTILDTGSTDNTIQIIEEVTSKYNKKGNIYKEPFINFRDSRNRLLELAGTDCYFNIMLDDTYVVNNFSMLYTFLFSLRADEFADSFSIYIKNDDIKYSSNRITKSHLNLKYVYKIHENIQYNTNVNIPEYYSYITDKHSNYMTERTINRKKQDLIWLFEELKEDPNNPRHLYYLAETFLCVKDYIHSYIYYRKRVEFKSNENDKVYTELSEEKYDSFYKSAVFADEQLNFDFTYCITLYEQAINFDKNRPDAYFQLGKLYLKNKIEDKAFEILKKCFTLCQKANEYNMNNKIDIYNYYCPKELLVLSYLYEDYTLGLDCCNQIITYLNSNKLRKMIEPNCSIELFSNWYKIFNNIKKVITEENNLIKKSLDKSSILNSIKEENEKELIVFLMNGGWDYWNGETLYNKGLGGSETSMIRYCETLATDFDVVAFTNCNHETIYNKVIYKPIYLFYSYICEFQCKIKVCFINRYPEFIFPLIHKKINCYLILHDLISTEEILPISSYFKGLLCLTNWHRNFLKNIFPIQKSDIFQYGIDLPILDYDNHDNYDNYKINNTFIYSSFPNRGLLELLKIFSRIIEKHPISVLNIFVDFDNSWLLKHHKPVIDEIKDLLSNNTNLSKKVINHGWVNKQTLNAYWKISKYWLYPCVFSETCCHTAYEAASNKTLMITSDLAALSETVGDRGIIIPGDASTDLWQNKAYDTICDIIEGKTEVTNLINKNYEWIKERSYKKVVDEFKNKYIYEN